MVRKNKNAVVVKNAIYKEAKKQGVRQISADAVKAIENELTSDLKCLIGKSNSFAKHAKRKKIDTKDVSLASKYPC